MKANISATPTPVFRRSTFRRLLVAGCLAFLLLLPVSSAVAAPSGGAGGTSLYFAEGYTGSGFQEYLCMFNTNSVTADVAVTYFLGNHSVMAQSLQIPATSRCTVDVNSAIGTSAEVSIKVTADLPDVVAERSMYFNYIPGVYAHLPGVIPTGWTGGSCVMGAFAPSNDWYFAEGTTRDNFKEYITVLNPGATAVSLNFTYMIEGAGMMVKSATAPAHSRTTFNAANHIGVNKDASLKLTSSGPVVAERPMYFDYQGKGNWGWNGGHCVMGATVPSYKWYFAEGCTSSNFEEWLCLQNPNSFAITVHATYSFLYGFQAPVHKNYTVGANERRTIFVPDEVGTTENVSVQLSNDSSQVFVAERPMYFNYKGWTGGSDTLGAMRARNRFCLAEGTTNQNFDTWLTVFNPNTTPGAPGTANVTLDYYGPNGKYGGRILKLPPLTRTTVYVNGDVPAGSQVSTVATSDLPIVIERPMYFDYSGQVEITGGHDVVGYPWVTR